MKNTAKSKQLVQRPDGRFTFIYHEELRFLIEQRSDGGWYCAGIDVEGETPQDVVEAINDYMRELSESY